MQDLDILKQVVEDNVATINGRDYEFAKLTHSVRLKVFSFSSTVGGKIQNADFGWMDSEKYKGIEKTILDYVLFDGVQVSKRADHFEKYPEDYLTLILTALGVISYPFLQG